MPGEAFAGGEPLEGGGGGQDYGGSGGLPQLRSLSADIKKAKSMKSIAELTKNPLATSTQRLPMIIMCLCTAPSVETKRVVVQSQMYQSTALIYFDITL